MNEELRNNAFEEDEDEIDLGEVLYALLNHWVFILLTTIITAAIVGLINYLVIVPQYESTAELYILDSSTTISSLTDIQIGNNMMDDYIETLSSRPVLDTVIENLELDEDYNALAGKVEISNENDTHIIGISVRDPNASRAKLIADEIAKVGKSFIADKMGQKEPSVLHYGYDDEGIVAPKRIRNICIGALGGLVASSALIAAMYLLNDKINSDDDVEKYLGLSVLGSLPLESDK